MNKNILIVFPAEKIVGEIYKNQDMHENELLITDVSNREETVDQLDRSFVDFIFIPKSKCLKF